jgi:hypothetical protein
MTKTITSPVERWPGEVVLFDPLTLPQEAAWAEGVAEAQTKRSIPGFQTALLPGIFMCVKEWHLGGGFPERPNLQNFPPRPRADVAQLIAWLTEAITELYREAVDVPNG